MMQIAMRGKPKKTPRQKDLTSDYMSGSLDEDRVEKQQRFTDRSKHGQREKMLKTAGMRSDEAALADDVDALPTGQVVQIHSLYYDVQHAGRTYLCVVRKTMVKVHGSVVVGDMVRFRVSATAQERVGDPAAGLQAVAPDGVVEQILPRKTILTRADSFKSLVSHPIVANADQVLIVASVSHPRPKWGLIDRVIVAAQSGGLKPIICLNKTDLPEDAPSRRAEEDEKISPHAALDYYASVGFDTIRTSAEQAKGIDDLQAALKDRETVLAGHSGVGKSHLIRAIQPTLDIRVGEVSQFTNKGRHTTTSARRYPLETGGAVIDTPGVKVFGLWNLTADTLIEHFPDVAAETAPAWRVASYQRILQSLTN